MPATAFNERSFDPDALREKYREERDKRIRSDGNEQYTGVTGDFSRYVDDPYVDPGKATATKRVGLKAVRSDDLLPLCTSFANEYSFHSNLRNTGRAAHHPTEDQVGAGPLQRRLDARGGSRGQARCAEACSRVR